MWTLVNARLGRVARMTLIRVAIAMLVLGSFTACDSDPGGSDDAAATPSGSPTSFELSGKISMEYSLSDVHTCEDVLLADLPAPQTDDEATAKIRYLEAQNQIDLIKDRKVTIRDSDEDKHLATLRAAKDVETVEAEDGEPEPGAISCVASTSFSTVLPPADSYLFVVRGVTGAPEPVAYEDLQNAGFVCEVHLDAGGGRITDAPCGV